MKLNRTLNRRLSVAAAAITLAAAAPANAAPQWLIPQAVSQPGKDASQQQVAFDQQGDAVAAWQSSGPQTVIMASVRPAGGAFSVPQTLSDPSAFSMSPDVASDAQGDAIAVWLQFEGTDPRVLAAYRPAGSPFGTPQTLSPAGYQASEPRVAMNPSGEAVLVWSLRSGLSKEIQASSAAPGGTFGTPSDLTGLTEVASVPQVALDSQGEAIAVWDGWDGAHIRIQDSLRPAGGDFGTPAFLSPSASNADTPQVAFDSNGNALATWRFDGSPASTIQAAYRPASGEFGAAQTVSAASTQPAQAPQAAFDGDDEAVVAWQQSDGSEPRIEASVRTPGAGSFSAQSTLDPGGPEAYEPRIAGDGLSGTIVSWKTFNGVANSTQATVRAAGGSFGAPSTISAENPQESAPEVGIDAQGNGIAVWSRSSGPNYLLEAAGYDGAGPQLRGLTLPTQGVVGQPLQFFLAPLDVWNAASLEGFSFGDGASAGGLSATHTYTTPGTYQVSATATDTLGNVTTVTRTVRIDPALAAAGPVAGAVHCTLTAARTQKLLNKGRIGASVECGTSIVIALDGRLTVRTAPVHGNAHGREATGTFQHSYTLTTTQERLTAGRRIEVQLNVPHGTLRSVLGALRAHHQVDLYLALVGVPSTQPGARAQTHITSIALAKPSPKGHARR